MLSACTTPYQEIDPGLPQYEGLRGLAVGQRGLGVGRGVADGLA